MRLALLFVLLPFRAAAEPVGEDDAPSPSRADEPTADDVAGAPPPGDESGRIDSLHASDSIARKVGRGALFVPRLALATVFAPVRAGIWAYDRYHLAERYLDLFFNDARTAGLVPTATLESGYGVTFGAKLLHRDVFGKREHASLRVASGGRYREVAAISFDAGDRFGRTFEVELTGRFERRPHDVFYGIGDDGGTMPQARFRQQLARATLASELRVAGPLLVRGSGALADFAFGRSDDGPPIDELYPMETVHGFPGVRHSYLELELAWDSRRHASRYEVPAVPANGALLSAFGGRVVALDDGADYWRYGGGVQHFVRVGAGPRVISTRLYAEAVSGTEVPFTQLPRLGGVGLLRGYPADRFRDRVAAVGSIAYSWDLSRALSTSLFVDVGRVAPSARELDLATARVGYGLEIEAHTARAFAMRVVFATSIDGGLFVDLAFDPAFDLRPRMERQ